MDYRNKITDKDVAVVEVLHDYLLEICGESLDEPMMVNARELIKKLYLLSHINEQDGIQN